MKRIIIDLREKPKFFKSIIQEAFNHNILDFLVSKESFNDLKSISRLNLYSSDENPKYYD
jgi:hypothetical protein